MKAKLILSFLLSFFFILLSSQVPQGFNYQAMATDGLGNPIKNTTLQVKLSILADTVVPTVIWEELYSTVKTNSNGVFSVVLGSGVRQTTSSVATFSAINWKASSRFIKTQVFYQNVWKTMGSAKLWSVPYAMVADNLSGGTNKLAITGTTTAMDEALFEVKNLNGQTVFAVYNEGVRVYVDDGAKGSKGGFSIGGFGADPSKGNSQPYLKVYRDSTRVFVRDAAKGAKGGFSIGGFTAAKGNSGNFIDLTPKNYFIGQKSGTYNTTGLYNSFVGYMSGYKNTTGKSNTFFGDSTGLNNTSGKFNVFMGKYAGYANDTSYSNVFIGNGAGKWAKNAGTSSGSYNVAIGTLAGYYNNGIYNVFIGQEAGFYNEKGKQNVFLGMGAGYNNDTASYNVAIGTDAGYNNMGIAGVFIGNFAGFDNLGDYNVLIGNNAGQATTTGEKNVILGSDAGYANTIGTYNTFLGNLSGADNIAGGWNVYIGNSAGEHATGNYNTIMGNVAGRKITADYNTMVGFQSGIMTTSGAGNAFFGHQSGHENISGTHNTYLGPSAGYYNTGGSSNVMIGFEAGAYEYGSNKLVIANASSSFPNTNSLIYGDFSAKQLRFNANVGINTAPSLSYQLYISGSAYSTVGFYYPSDIRLKQNIKSMENEGVIDKVKDMQVIKYNYTDVITKGDPALDVKYIGVVAQDIEASFPEAVKTDASGYKAVSINALTAILLQAIKDQQKEIDLLKSEVELLKAKK